MLNPNRPILIEIYFADGSVEWASGEGAQKLLAWWQRGEIALVKQGLVYEGPPLQRTEQLTPGVPVDLQGNTQDTAE